MNRIMMIAVCAAAITTALVVAPQQAEAKRGSIGFGASLDLQLQGANVLVPITVSDLITIEPEIGFFQRSQDDGNDTTTSDLNLRAGVGVLFKNSITKKTNVYGGVRLGLQFNSNAVDNDGNEVETTSTDFIVGGVAGGEYFIDNAFSIGGEWGIFLVSAGEPTVTVDGDEQDQAGASDTTIATRTQVFFRWYFM